MLNMHANTTIAIPVAFKRAASVANEPVPSVAFNNQMCGSSTWRKLTALVPLVRVVISARRTAVSAG
jgi:hypothetical protein